MPAIEQITGGQGSVLILIGMAVCLSVVASYLWRVDQRLKNEESRKWRDQRQSLD